MMLLPVRGSIAGHARVPICGHWKLTPGRGPRMLTIWVIYDHPTDFPHGFIARRWENDQPTEDALRSTSLAPLRKHLEDSGLTCIPRSMGDDPAIVESWL